MTTHRICQRLLILTLIFSPSVLFAEPVATAFSVKGEVQAKSVSDESWQPVSRQQTFANGDQIRTGENSRAGLKLKSGRLVRLRENSVMTIRLGDKEEPKGRLDLVSGALHLFSRKAKQFPKVKTNDVTAAIRGTEFVIEKTKSGTKVQVLDGQVLLGNSEGEVTLAKGEQGSALEGIAPSRGILVSPQDAVQWTLSSPVLIAPEDLSDLEEGANVAELRALKALRMGEHVSERLPGDTWRAKLIRSLTLAQRGETNRAWEEIRELSSKDSASVASMKAALLLAFGKPDEANKALDESPSSIGIVRAQRALINVLEGDPEKAEALLRDAGDSLTALLVRSYLFQSQGDIEGANAAIQRALVKAPQNPFVIARQAEVLLAQGHLARAEEVVSTITEGSAAGEYAKVVTGFAFLLRGNASEAIVAFESARKLAPEAADPVFGLALAEISRGNLESGNALLETAAHLEPTRAVLRSYLGKSYYEAEEEGLAEREFTRAIDLDPNDPTPYLYRAFNRVSRNQIVAALGDVEDSIARNENRAVYRSSFLLDQDQATRGTSLALVYQELGFSEVSRREALRSLANDYSNYAAHRLLADSLDGAFFDDARFTQGVIADLLAPVSFNVFQSLDGFSSSGGLGEYIALFDRPTHRTGIVGELSTQDDIISGSVFQTGKENAFGYFIGASGLLGDGSKSGDIYQRDYRFDLGVQYQLDPDNRLILNTAFDARDTSEQLEGVDVEDFDISLGSHHVFGPHSKLINRVEYFARDVSAFDDGISREGLQSILFADMLQDIGASELLIDEETDEEFWSLRYASQFIYDSESIAIIAGAEYLDADGESDENSSLLEDSLDSYTGLDRRLRSRAENTPDAFTAYIYSKLSPLSFLDLDLGLTYRDIELPAFDVLPPYVSGERSESELSPKVGLSLQLIDNLAVHGAYFQSLGSSTLSDIGSIEPTFVSIFNQLQGDLPGAKSETFAFGADYKLPKQVYAGVEFQARDIERDLPDVDTTLITNLDTLTESQQFSVSNVRESEREKLLRTYLYGVFSQRLVGTLDHLYSRLESVTDDQEIDTNRVRLGLRYFSPRRYFASTELTWRYQDVDGLDSLNDGSRDFWIWDAALGYRLPKRKGTVRILLRNILDQSFSYFDDGREAEFFPNINASLQYAVNF